MSQEPRRLDIDGEYNQVSRASADVEALRLAHGTPCTQREAAAMLAALTARTGVTVRVRFGARHGRCSLKPIMARVYFSDVRTRRKLYRRTWAGERELLISLPKEPRGQHTRGWGLRVGLVLHEFAHAVAEARKDHMSVVAPYRTEGHPLGMKGAGHGPWFTWLLDGLVADWKDSQRQRSTEAA